LIVNTVVYLKSMQDTTSGKKKWLGYFILISVFFLFSVLPIIIIKSSKNTVKQLLPQPIVVETPCFKFNLTSYFKPTDKNNSEKCTIETKDLNTKLFVSLVLSNNLTENSLKQIAENNKRTFLSTFPTAKIESEGQIKFAGLSGYGYSTTYKPTTKTTKKVAVYWLYNPKSDIKIENIRVKVFSVAIISNPGMFTNIFNDIEKSWRWETTGLIENGQNTDQTTIITPCYKVQSQINIEKTYEANDCDLSIKLTDNQKLIGIIGVHQFADSTATLEKEIEGWKEFNKSIVILSEKDLQVGSFPAQQIIYKSSSKSDTLFTDVFIYSDNRYEKIFGYPVNGFIISSLYDDESEIKSNFDYLISNWTWL